MNTTQLLPFLSGQYRPNIIVKFNDSYYQYVLKDEAPTLISFPKNTASPTTNYLEISYDSKTKILSYAPNNMKTQLLPVCNFVENRHFYP